MPRTKEANDQIKEEKIEIILTAGLKIFSEVGLSAAKMTDIAETAAISYGLVYRYFPSKEAIFLRIINDSFKMSQNFVDGIRRKQLSPLKNIEAVFRELFKKQSSNKKFEMYYKMIFQLNFHPEFWASLTINDFSSEPVVQFLYDAVSMGQRNDKIIGKEPREVILLLASLASSLGLQTHLLLSNDINVDIAVELILRMIKK